MEGHFDRVGSIWVGSSQFGSVYGLFAPVCVGAWSVCVSLCRFGPVWSVHGRFGSVQET